MNTLNMVAENVCMYTKECYFLVHVHCTQVCRHTSAEEENSAFLNPNLMPVPEHTWDWQPTAHQGKPTFLDFSKDFNAVSHKIFLHKMSSKAKHHKIKFKKGKKEKKNTKLP